MFQDQIGSNFASSVGCTLRLRIAVRNQKHVSKRFNHEVGTAGVLASTNTCGKTLSSCCQSCAAV